MRDVCLEYTIKMHLLSLNFWEEIIQFSNIIEKYKFFATGLCKTVNGLSQKLVSDCFKLNNISVHNIGNRYFTSNDI